VNGPSHITPWLVTTISIQSYTWISMTRTRRVKVLASCALRQEMAVGRKRDGVFLVFEYCEHDMANLIDNMGKRFSDSEVNDDDNDDDDDD
jgi:hypothetical protein